MLIVGGALFTCSRQAYFIVLFASALLLLRRSKPVLAVVLSVILISLSGYLPDSVAQRVEETWPAGQARAVEEVDESTARAAGRFGKARMEMLAAQPDSASGLNRFPLTTSANIRRTTGMDAHNFCILLTLAECGPQGADHGARCSSRR